MSCKCAKNSQERQSYDNIKKIAQSYADNEEKTVILFRDVQGFFSFIEFECPEATGLDPVEFILPV